MGKSLATVSPRNSAVGAGQVQECDPGMLFFCGINVTAHFCSLTCRLVHVGPVSFAWLVHRDEQTQNGQEFLVES